MTKKQKIYCYVDETGQDTAGELFIVAIVVTDEQREKLAEEAEIIEVETKKGLAKWRRAAFASKIAYIAQIIASPAFKGSLYYGHYPNSKDYQNLMIDAVSKAIIIKAGREYQAFVFVDGLRDANIHEFSQGLRHRGIPVHKTRGRRDESDALIRVADALAGFIRDSLEEQNYTKGLWKILKARIKNVLEIKKPT